MKCTNNGLAEFEKERNSLLNDAKNLISLCASNEGHLGDIVGCLRTTMSSIAIKANRLQDVFNAQKRGYKCPNCGVEHLEENCNGFCSAACYQEY